MMQGLRGSGLNDSDRQIEGLEMRLVDVPTDQEGAVAGAAKFNEIVTTLGPFFIKLGQALSIRPDLLSPRAMVELQKLCDKVPSYSTEIAMQTLEDELSDKFGKRVRKEDVFSEITSQPVAAASLGQVYRAVLREPAGAVVAVKEVGLRDSRRTDFVSLLDEFAARIYEELDYNQECANGLLGEQHMAHLERVKIPKNFEQYCCRKVHVAEWVEGEKLSQSQAGDVRELVNVGVVAYLTQLLDKGLFHADPHPGNMLRTPDGRLAILDFGLMTNITDDQRYGMVEAISHLVHRDYAEIGGDFQKLDFIPDGVDVKPIVPALSRVFDAALAGRCRSDWSAARGINFNELSADLAQITFEFPFRIPPYFALIIRAIGVLEGIALVGDPDFAIIDEAYPYLSKQLLTNPSDRLRSSLRYMVYGKEGVFDADRLIDLLRALEAGHPKDDEWMKYTPTEKAPDAEELARKAARNQGSGLVQDMQRTDPPNPSNALLEMLTPMAQETKVRQAQMSTDRVGDRPTSWALATQNTEGAREALTFLLTVKGIDCLGRGGVQALGKRLARASPLRLLPGIGPALLESPLGPFGDLFAPPLTAEEEKVVSNTTKVIAFLLGDREMAQDGGLVSAQSLTSVLQLFREDPRLAEGARELAQKLARRAFELVSARALRRLADRIPSDRPKLAAA
eukprot:g30301.t1